MKYSINHNLIAKLVSRSSKDELQFYKVDTSGNLSLHGSVFLDESVMDFAWGQPTSSKKKRELNGSAKNHTGDASVIAVLSSGAVVSISAQSMAVVKHEVKVKLTQIISVEDNTIWGVSKGHIYRVELDGKCSKVKLPEFESVFIKNGVVYIGTSSGLLIGKMNKNAFEKDMEVKTGFKVLSIEAQGSVIVASSLSKAVLVDGTNCKELFTGNDVKVQITEEIFIISSNALKIFTTAGDYIKTISSSHPIDYVFSTNGFHYVSWHDDANIHIQQVTKDTDSISFQNGTSAKQKNLTLIHIDEGVAELDAKSVESQLLDILSQDNINDREVTQVCSSLNNDNDVKHIVSNLPQEHVERLFKAMNTTTPTWLKWILLIHGNLIAKSSTSVKDLQENLRSSVGSMSHLYAIKGKLQLLQLQSQIKDASIDNDITTTIEDETMVYANGEVDELNRL